MAGPELESKGPTERKSPGVCPVRTHTLQCRILAPRACAVKFQFDDFGICTSRVQCRSFALGSRNEAKQLRFRVVVFYAEIVLGRSRLGFGSLSLAIEALHEVVGNSRRSRLRVPAPAAWLVPASAVRVANMS